MRFFSSDEIFRSHLFFLFACCASLKFQMKLCDTDWNCFCWGEEYTLNVPRNSSALNPAIYLAQWIFRIGIARDKSLIKFILTVPAGGSVHGG
jgi:hypothetical protein